MQKIQGQTIREFKDKNEQFWFSVIADKIEKLDFGKLEIKLTIRKGKVVNLQTLIGDSVPIPDDL
jgi:hypothetical protein